MWLLFVHGRCGIRVDDAGLCDLSTRTEIRWDEIREIQLLGENVTVGSKRGGLRFAQIKAADGRAIRFADLGPLGLRAIRTQVGMVQDVPQSGLLLGLIADHTQTQALFPPQWLDVPQARPAADAPMVIPVDHAETPPVGPGAGPSPSPPPSSSRPDQRRKARLAQRWPVAALILKLLGNFWKLIGVGLKTIKVGPAALSFGAFAVVLQSWHIAALLLLMIGFHECGHVYAMWRCGVPVKGIYFIPFLGGAAVSQGLAKTRWANAFIEINGPIYGTVLALLFLAGFYLTGKGYEWLAVVAGWGALINLFNLLPIMPLDGGRMLGEISHSLHRAAGRYAVLGSLLLGGVAAYLSGLHLLWIMVLVGTLEFGRQLTAATQKALMDRLGQHRPVSYEVDEHFGILARVMTQPLSDARRQQARTHFDMVLTEARMVPMKGWQTAVVAAGYLSLAVVLVVLLWQVSHIAGADHAFELLR